MTSFQDLGVPPGLADVLASRGMTSPFPIQAATIRETLAGRDLCGRAPTGSGKTIAFAVPLAMNTPKASRGRLAALVLVPTRELASQVAEELRPLASSRGRTVETFYGGTPIRADQKALRRGVDIAIACPGRLADLVERGDADLSEVGIVVLDEADRMADMGFLPEVRRLLDRTPANRQTLLFSATLDGDVDVLIKRYQRKPVRHELAESGEDNGEVRHLFWRAEAHKRVDVTGDIVRTVDSAIVFTRTKHGADRIARQLGNRGVSAAAIHGDRSQRQRERALADFTAGRVTTLVATDVAARGIHVDAVGMVVHFDPPATDKDYVHRSGRTGRAGADGIVVTLVPPDKLGDVKGLQRALAMPQGVSSVSMEQLGNMRARTPQPASPSGGATRRPFREPGRPGHGRPGGSGASGSPRGRTGGAKPRSGGGTGGRAARRG